MSDTAFLSAQRTATATVRRIRAAEVWAALRAGWDDFRAIPTQLFFLCLLYPVVGIAAARLSAGLDVLPLLFPLAAGLALLGPVLAVGIYELSRRRERGLTVSSLDALGVLRSPSIFAIAVLGTVLLAIFVAWIGVANLIFAAFIGAAPSGADDFIRALATPQGWAMMAVGDVVGAVFALLVLALTVVSVPMALDRQVSPLTAMQTSLRAFAANPGPVLLWGMLVGIILVLGSLPLFIGLAVAIPVLGHATWHLYRRIIA